jgi:prephenate dehydrogenase
MIIGIAGLGLIGGSMAKAYKANSDAVIYGHDTDSSVLNIAKIYGAVDETLTKENIQDCDVILLCLYTRPSIEYLREIAPLVRKDAFVIDCCGTKRRICEEGFALAKEYGFTFVGGHPMAGTHHSGFRSSTEELFRDQPMVIIPPVYDDILLLEKIKQLLAPCRFGTFSVTTAEEHDRLIAFTSQMAHIVSNAFIKSPSALQHKGISAGSYKDLTRVAWLNPSMWADLFLDNKENILFELDTFIDAMQQYRQAIEDENLESLCALLEEGRRLKQEVDG